MNSLNDEVAIATDAMQVLTEVAFLASDAARWITGASIPVDRGSKL